MKRFGLFLTFFVILYAIATVGWDRYATGQLYNCSDEIGLGFVIPGDWVHGDTISVSQITPSDDMTKPDQLLEGWTNQKLWALWGSITASIFALSYLLSYWAYKP